MIDRLYSRHAETRMQQRGIRERDIPLVLALGTQVEDGTWILLRRDVTREIGIRKREIQELERLQNCKVVTLGGHVITVYPSRPSDQKHTLRRARQTGMAQ